MIFYAFIFTDPELAMNLVPISIDIQQLHVLCVCGKHKQVGVSISFEKMN